MSEGANIHSLEGGVVVIPVRKIANLVRLVCDRAAIITLFPQWYWAGRLRLGV